jgi:hypothetical protein
VTGVCENSISHTGSIKGEQFFNQMSDYQLSKYVGAWNHCGHLYFKCNYDAASSGEVIMVTIKRTVNAAGTAEEHAQKDGDE